MAIPIAYNVRNLFVRRLSTSITVIGIGLVVAVFVAVLALANGFEVALADNGLDNNAVVLRVPGNDELSSSITREWAGIIATQPEVAKDPEGRPMYVTEQVVIVNLERKSTGGIANIIVRGTGPTALQLRPKVRIAEGRMFTPGTDEVVVGRILTQRFRACSLGDQLKFGGRSWKVVGVLDAGSTSFESEIWGDAEIMGPAFDRTDYQSLTFRLGDPTYLEAVKKRLEEDRRMQVVVKREKDYYSDQSIQLATTIRILGTFVTVVMAFGAVFGALNTMYAAVAARRREIGTLLALGFSRRSVLVSFVLESMLLAAIGGLLGCLLSLPVNGVSTGTTNWATFSEVAFRIRIEPQMFAGGMMFALVMGLVGGFFPALNAARGEIAEVVRRA